MGNNHVCIGNLLRGNEYPGRGIVIGKSPDRKNAVFAYFIMGRSANSRNRVFEQTADGIRTKAHDPSKMTDPSLIIYSPVRKLDKKYIVTNGDQTDTVFDYLSKGKCFSKALSTRTFEPDSPNWTPRISGLLDLDDGFSYKMSILKCADGSGGACNRFFFEYEPQNGLGHFLHTYAGNGDPIPSFAGEPASVAVLDDIDEYTRLIWDNLNDDNKVSLFVCFVNLESGEEQIRILNKNV